MRALQPVLLVFTVFAAFAVLMLLAIMALSSILSNGVDITVISRTHDHRTGKDVVLIGVDTTSSSGFNVYVLNPSDDTSQFSSSWARVIGSHNMNSDAKPVLMRSGRAYRLIVDGAVGVEQPVVEADRGYLFFEAATADRSPQVSTP